MNPADLTESLEIFQEIYNNIRTFRAEILPQTNQLLRLLESHDNIIVAHVLNDEVRSLNTIVQQLSQNPLPHAKLTEQLQAWNNQHRNPGRMVPEVKRALNYFGLEELSYNADKYKVYPSGALKISYSSKIDARRQLVYLRRRVGQLKRNARERHDTMDHEYLYRSNHKYRAACDMKFSLSIPGRFQHERELFKKAAKILKSRNEIKWWECLMIGEQLVMKACDRRNTFKYVALDEAEEICRDRPGENNRNEIEE